jgi:hypothetical protein
MTYILSAPTPPLCAKLTPHVLVEHSTSVNTAHPVAVANLLDRVQNYLHARGSYSQGRSIRERVLAIREDVFGLVHPATASSVDFVAFDRLTQGDYPGAQSPTTARFISLIWLSARNDGGEIKCSCNGAIRR